jgi:hypothetical protein
VRQVSVESPRFAFLSQGKLYLQDGREGAAAVAIDSTFAEDVRRREDEVLRRKAWKSEGASAFLSGMSAIAREVAPSPGARIESLAPGRRPGEILFTLRVGQLGGLFSYDWSVGRESRIHHGRETRITDLSRPGPDGNVACSVSSANGSRHLALLKGDGYDLEEITEGDSLDAAPSFSADGGAIVFQSAGIARGPDGHILGVSPWAICRLDLATGELDDLLREDRCDLLYPHEAADGSLTFVRRRHGARGPSLRRYLKWVVGLVLLPVRLLKAVFQWLNFFTIRYTGNPLTTGDGHKVDSEQAREMLALKQMMDTARREGEARSREHLAEVASESRLVRRSKEGEETLLASGVLFYDVGSDGEIVYTTGTEVFRITPDGRRHEVATGVYAEGIVSLT